MTPDPITAALQQLADHHEQLIQLTDLIVGIGDTLREHEAALAKLAETDPDPNRYRPTRGAWRSADCSQRKARTGPRRENLARSVKDWNIPNGRRCLHEAATAGKRGLLFKLWPCSPARNAA